MTYSAWLVEVDAAFLKSGKSSRVAELSPSVLLREYEKGTTPEQFVQLPTSRMLIESANSSTNASCPIRDIFTFFEDTSVLRSLNLPQAGFVVKSLNVLGVICLVIAAALFVWGVHSVAQAVGVLDQAQKPLQQAAPVSAAQAEAAASAAKSWAPLTYFSTAFTFFASGILFWWAASMLRGFYWLLGKS